MKIVHNDSSKNHQKIIQNLLKKSDELFITSPFLAPDFGTLINYGLLNKLKKITLITTLKSKTPDQINKVSVLYSLVKNLRYSNKLHIYVDNKLHSKIYIFKLNNKYLAGIITSANFTLSGLTTNHETGVEIYDEKILRALELSTISFKGIQKFDIEKIEEMKTEVETYLKNNKHIQNEKIELDLSKYLKNNSNFEPSNYWLKPIGVTDHPVDTHEVFNVQKEGLYFSKVRPTGVKLNDLLIAYGVGVRKILSIYRVISSPLYATPKQIKKHSWKERWPWYVMAENITLEYGSNWSKHNLILPSLVEDFKKTDLTGVLTKVGGYTLGALNYHIDKINLRKEFAEYIIGRVFQLNNQ